MNFRLKSQIILAFLLVFPFTYLLGQKPLHTINIKNTRQLHDFFKWTGHDIPIVSGHRGGMEDGFPENSIEAFEHTLRHTPAIFEIDPRLTKDSVIILMHDATLERTTNGTGKVSDYTYAELKQLFLKDKNGNITPYRIPTLSEALQWAKGKTILNFDKKDVPLYMSAAIIKQHKAEAYTMLTVHNGKDAEFYFRNNPEVMFSAFVKTPEQLKEYEQVGIPYSQMIAYIGPDIKASNQVLYELLNGKGIMCMISSAPTYDKLKTKEERAEAFRNIINDGASILESDLPNETAAAIANLIPAKSVKKRYFKIKK
jgi:glycerophosphoryl diester phosphodiesterase